MSLRSSIFQFFSTHPSLQSTVGGSVHPHFIPTDAALPALVFAVGDIRHEQDLSGASGSAQATITLQVWSNDYEEADAIGEILRTLLLGMDDNFGELRGALCTDLTDRDLFWASPDQEDRRAFGQEFTFDLRYEESIPATNRLGPQ